MYLVDTNIWLERLLDQEKSEEVRRFLDSLSSDQLFVTDFTLHSIGVILTRLNQKDDFLRFVRDVFVDGSVTLVSVPPTEMTTVANVMEQFRLDFDDAYQYTAALRRSLAIVSLDSDFDRTELGRKTPSALLVE